MTMEKVIEKIEKIVYFILYRSKILITVLKILNADSNAKNRF